jgi:hypothetical protein
MESVFEHIPQKLFPKEYGGEAGTINELVEIMDKKFISYRDYFLHSEKWGVDENKRPGRPKNAQTLFGIDGSFRSLSID